MRVLRGEVSEFQRWLQKSERFAVLTGAGVSAESGIPTFRGPGGLWRQYSAVELATPQAWSENPGLVWEFYNYRRVLMGEKRPNPAHLALAKIEKEFQKLGKAFTLITQNIDDLHLEAGSQNLIRLHGSLWEVRCVRCAKVSPNREVPITPAFAGTGGVEGNGPSKAFREADLPHCSECGGLLRPHVVWFGEMLDPEVLASAQKAALEAELFLVVGTSAVVYPAAGLVELAAQGGAKIAVVNLDVPVSHRFLDFVFEGAAGEILPSLLQFPDS
ncbi:MAG: NAD-dependent deacylase [Planctomycetota bacterium]|nr:MAG: NAD-dependent deacylase [Planctomycetota bacterium]